MVQFRIIIGILSQAGAEGCDVADFKPCPRDRTSQFTVECLKDPTIGVKGTYDDSVCPGGRPSLRIIDLAGTARHLRHLAEQELGALSNPGRDPS